MLTRDILYFGLLISLLAACKIHPNSSRYNEENDPGKVYHLRLNPPVGSQYTYTVSRSTEYSLQVDDKKVENKNRSNVEVTYTIGRDSSGNFLLNVVYNKIHLYTKNGDTEEEQDADKASESADPVERALGILKGSEVMAVVSSDGQVKSLKGDEVIKDKLLAGFSPTDNNARAIASQQWDRQIKDGMLKNNMQQLFNVFPDSSVHVGNRWKLTTTQHEQVDLVTNVSCQLKEIVDGNAVIRSQGEITSDRSLGSLNGTSYTADLKGKEEGELEMDTSTGMLLSSKTESDITGTLSSMGRDVPITIKISTKIVGRKVQ